MAARQAGYWLVPVTLFVTLLLMLVPLPAALLAIRPNLLAMTLVFWGLERPTFGGLGTAFVAGLCYDILAGQLLGQSALTLVVTAFMAARFRLRIRFFPLWQQALVVGAILANERLLTAVIRSMAGDPVPGPLFWLSPIIGVLVWPWFFLIVDRALQRARFR